MHICSAELCFSRSICGTIMLPLAEISYVACHTDCSFGKVNGARGPWVGKLVLEYMGSLEGC